MKVRQRIEGTSYGPEALNTMTQAFGQAWSVIARNINRDASEAARARLAKALLSVAAEDSRDVQALKRKALEAMALSCYAVPSDISRSGAPARMQDSSSPEKKLAVANWASRHRHTRRAPPSTRSAKHPI